MRKINHTIIVKYLILFFALWAFAGMLYFAIETYYWLDHEASTDFDQPTPLWQTLAYGPLYWFLYVIIYIIALTLK